VKAITANGFYRWLSYLREGLGVNNYLLQMIY